MIRDIQKIDDDICNYKRIIKEKLYSDPDIIEVLDNSNLSPDEPDTYVDVNIFDYIRIPGTTTEKLNYICFDLRQDNLTEQNNHIKNFMLVFNVYVHEDYMKTPYGVTRHDLLGYLIRDIFNYSNMFGPQLELITDTPGMMDTQWQSRCLTFKEKLPASLNRAVRTNKYEFPK